MDRSGVVTCTVPSTPSQRSVTAGNAAPRARDPPPRPRPGGGQAEEEHDLRAFSGAQLDHRLKGAAWVEAGADPSREPAGSLERRRGGGRPGPPAELGA